MCSVCHRVMPCVVDRMQCMHRTGRGPIPRALCVVLAIYVVKGVCRVWGRGHVPC